MVCFDYGDVQTMVWTSWAWPARIGERDKKNCYMKTFSHFSH